MRSPCDATTSIDLSLPSHVGTVPGWYQDVTRQIFYEVSAKCGDPSFVVCEKHHEWIVCHDIHSRRTATLDKDDVGNPLIEWVLSPRSPSLVTLIIILYSYRYL
eukprot:scaffold89095_cov46-Attheya_sp.AAC.1